MAEKFGKFVSHFCGFRRRSFSTQSGAPRLRAYLLATFYYLPGKVMAQRKVLAIPEQQLSAAAIKRIFFHFGNRDSHRFEIDFKSITIWLNLHA